MNIGQNSEEIFFRGIAVVHPHSEQARLAECLIDKEYFFIKSDEQLRIPLKEIKLFTVFPIKERETTNKNDANDYGSPVELTYINQYGERWWLQFQLNVLDIAHTIKIFEKVGIPIDKRSEIITASNKDILFEGILNLQSKTGQIDKAKCHIGNGFLFIESEMPLKISLKEIAQVTFSAPYDIKSQKGAETLIGCRKAELVYLNDNGSSVLNFELSAEDSQKLLETLQAEKVRVTQQPENQVNVEPTFFYAGFWRRLFAYMIDSTIILFISITADILLALIASSLTQNMNEKYFSAVYENSLFVTTLITTFYYIIFWIRGGQTPGKMLLHIRIVTSQGKPITFGRALLRYFGYVLSTATLYLGFLWIIWDKKKQGFQDKIAGTIVINEKMQFQHKAVTNTINKWNILSPLIAISGALFGILPIAVEEGKYFGFFGPFIAAPIIEEAIKPLGVYILLAKKSEVLKSKRYTVFLSALAGLAFGIVESTMYVLVNSKNPTVKNWDLFVIWRFTICLLLHTGCSLIVGLGINQQLADSVRGDIPFLKGNRKFFIIPMLIHAGYNIVVTVLTAINLIPI